MQARLALLLSSLNTETFEQLPPQVGRKTVNLADEGGLVDVEPGRLLRPRCRLTQAGWAYRTKLVSAD